MIGPPPKIYLGSLTPSTPTPFTTTALKSQLANVGLDCGQLNDYDLESYIKEVTDKLYEGKVKTFLIEKPIQNQNVRSFIRASNYEKAATGNWEPNDFAQGYANVLQIVQYPEHFNWLYDNRNSNGFTGQIDDPPEKTGYYSNADAIKKLFVDVGVSASSTLVEGLDKPSMEAVLHNVIAPLTDSDLHDYDDQGKPSRVIYLVYNYDFSTGYADGIGVLSTGWHLRIKDFKRKTKDGGDTHDTKLKTTSRAVLYYGTSGVNLLCAHFNAVVKQFNLDTPVTCPPF